MTIHATHATDQDDNYVHSNLFGKVQKTLIDKVEGKQLEDVFLRLLQMRREAFDARLGNAQATIQAKKRILDELEDGGIRWHNLFPDLEHLAEYLAKMDFR